MLMDLTDNSELIDEERFTQEAFGDTADPIEDDGANYSTVDTSQIEEHEFDDVGEVVNENCQFCGNLSNLEAPLRDIGHFVCRSCFNARKDTHNYRLMSQTSVLQHYGLSLKNLKDYNEGKSIIVDQNHIISEETIDDIQMLPKTQKLAIKTMPNPRGYGSPMKLFYLFQVCLGAILVLPSLSS